MSHHPTPQEVTILDIARALVRAEQKKKDPHAVHHSLPPNQVEAAKPAARKIWKHIETVLMNQRMGLVPEADILSFVNACRDINQNIKLLTLANKLNEQIQVTYVRDTAKGNVKDPRTLRDTYLGKTQDLLLSLNEASFVTAIENRSRDRLRELALFEEPEVPANSIAVPAAKNQTISIDIRQI